QGAYETFSLESNVDRSSPVDSAHGARHWHRSAGSNRMSTPARGSFPTLHTVGVMSGIAAGAWLGSAEAPTKLVTMGFSPFVISLGMVMGVFVARWTIPVALKGTGY